jgi:hypothetical protein
MKPKGPALIFSTVLPEPESSAAGVRQMQWIHALLRAAGRVVLMSPSAPKKPVDWGYISFPPGVEVRSCALNDWSLSELIREMDPAVVLFDRFITEEQFGPLIQEAAPRALRLLETQDLHFLRRARGRGERDPGLWKGADAIRETAAILRSDHAFVVSSFEAELLNREFGIGTDHVSWIPFSYSEGGGEGRAQGFEGRSGFQFIGNFRHAPNMDGLRWFLSEVWPGIRNRLPGIEVKIHGAYPSAEVSGWHRPKENGVRVIGSVRELKEAFRGVRVNLAPLRFGAGVKGKVLDGFHHGVPAVSTLIAAEGLMPLANPLPFPGLLAGSPEEWVEACVRLHEDPLLWEEARSRAALLMESFYSAHKVERLLDARIEELFAAQERGETPRWLSRILRDEFQSGRKYFSKWIEAKSQASVENR